MSTKELAKDCAAMKPLTDLMYDTLQRLRVGAGSHGRTLQCEGLARRGLAFWRTDCGPFQGWQLTEEGLRMSNEEHAKQVARRRRALVRAGLAR